jgi:multiple sugar transport system ATP-binding protein
LYANPVNLFVAGFIGSPAMNFMAGTLEEGSLRTALGSLPLSPALQQALERANVGRDVIVGIRPENFQDALLVQPDLRSQGIVFRATIDVLESMGSDVYVYFTQQSGLSAQVDQLADLAADSGQADTGATEESVTARLDASTQVREGDNAELWADVRAMHIFDPQSGKNLTLEAGTPAAPAAAST